MAEYDADPTESVRAFCRQVAKEQGGDTELAGDPDMTGKDTGGLYAGGLATHAAEEDMTPFEERHSRPRGFSEKDNVSPDHDVENWYSSWD
ncbi:MAG TPA: hypothetical protein VIH42_11100 [Thermoguttaceae bacterium]